MKNLFAFVMLFCVLSTSFVSASGFDRTISGSSTACKGDTKTFSLLLFPDGNVDWQVTGGAVILEESEFEVTVKFNYAGTVTLKAVTDMGSTYSKTIRVYGNPTLSIRQAPKFPMGNELEFIANPSGSVSGTYQWDAGFNQVDANGRYATVYFNTPHIVRCTFHGACGSATAEIMPNFVEFIK